MTTETWKEIPKHPGFEASDLGRIRNARTLRLLRPREDRRGYKRLNMRVGIGKARTRYVHQLVLEAFVGQMPEGGLTRHLDGNPKNNALTNLCYGTSGENGGDTRTHIRHRRGLTDDRMREIHLKHGVADALGPEAAARCMTSVAEEFSVSLGYIMNALDASPELVSDDERHVVRAYKRHAARVLKAIEDHEKRIAAVRRQYEGMLSITAGEVRVLARAREVRRLRAQGHTYRAIGQMLGISHAPLVLGEQQLKEFEFLTVGFGTA